MTSVLDQVARKGQRGNFLEDLQGALTRIARLERYLSTSGAASSGSMHDPVTLGASCADELTLSGQALTLAEVISDSEHTAALHEVLSIDHGSLSGRNDDDHTIYLPANGSRPLTGNLSVDSGITIDGVDISVHAANADAHHAGFIGLTGDTGSATPNASDTIALSGGNGVVTAGSGNAVTITARLGTGLTFSSGQIVLNWSGTPGTIQPDAGAAAGSSNYAARIDHQHAIACGAPTTDLSVSSTNTEGSGNDFARATHTHAIATSSDPGPAARILASTVAGALSLLRLNADTIADRSGGDLTISPTGDLVLNPTGAQVRIAASHTLQSNHYASQTTGWGITYAGAGDFRYLFADELHAKSFITDLEQALAGGQIICKSVAMVSRDFTAPAAGAAVTLYVRDLPSAENMAVFQSGDVVRLRTFSRAAGSLTIADCWGVVTSYSNLAGTEQSWTFTRSTGGNAGSMTAGTVIAADSLALDYGTTGNGFYEVNAVDGAYGANSPYAQIVTWTTHPATGKTVRTRLGNLYGITATTEYGLFAGEGVTAGDSYLRLTDQNFELHNLDLAMYDSGNVQRIGMDAGAAAGDKLMWAGVSLTDPKFIVYGNGNVWLSTLAISDRMGAPIFSLADGALLLGPSCAITPTSWTSTRGQTATISGAFHQVDGRWPGTRALTVELGTTNYAVNPRPSSSGSSWAVYGGSFSFVSETGPFIGNTVGQIVATAAANFKIGQCVGVRLTTGDVWTVSFWARATTSEYVKVTWQQTASPYNPASNYWNFTIPTTWTKFTGTLTVTANRSAQLIMDSIAAGNTIQVANVQIEKLAYVTSYCDGDLGVGYSWSGTPHASTSARVASLVNLDDHANTMDSMNTQSHSIWVQVPYGAAATWPRGSSVSYVLDISDDAASQRIRLAYDEDLDRWTVYINGGTRIYSPVQTFEAGNWMYLTLTTDFASDVYCLYINGALSGSSTAAIVSPSGLTNWKLGAGYNGTLQAGYVFGEYAVFNRVLTAEEVSTIYALNRPLSDCGSYSTPGVYILDGKFDLRSSTTGARVQVDVDGISGWSSDTTRTFALETDGDFFAGSNLASPLTTTLAVFSNDQTYGGESFGAGDVLIGCNVSMPNLLFDLSASKLSFRGGTTETMVLFYNGSATFGEVAANKFNLMWDATVGDLLIRQNSTAYFQVDGSASLLKFGSNVSAAATTAIAIFGANQTYNSEAVGAGDLLLGDNSASKANVLWDKSAGKLLFRGGSTTQVEIGTDGYVYAGGGNVKIGSTGLSLTQGTGQANSVTWSYSDSNIETRIRSYSAPYSTVLDLQAADYNTSPGGVALSLSAVGGAAGSIYTSFLLTKEYATLYGFSDGTPIGDLRIRCGLYVGGISTDPGDGNVELTGVIKIDGTQVVRNRVTGWAAATGTAKRTTFATSTVTLSVLAEHVKALIDDLTTHGLIGS